MSRRIQGRVITAAAIVAALALANPVHAASRGTWGDPSGLFLHAWQWLARALPGTGANAKPPIAKAGMGVDPDGRQAPGTAPVTAAPSDGGMGVDPNG
ncbi:MAG: hypothetical protein ABIS20_21655 [Thermoanaerobaculia bacterium]